VPFALSLSKGKSGLLKEPLYSRHYFLQVPVRQSAEIF